MSPATTPVRPHDPVASSLLFWAAVPALALSIWLLHIAQLPRSTQILQVVVASLASFVFVVLARRRGMKLAGNTEWLALVLALTLFIPLLTNEQNGPERWLLLGGVRLYVA